MHEIIYLNPFKDLMVQRPQQLLREFGKQGYRAVQLNINEEKNEIIQVGENYYIYNKNFPFSIKPEKRVLWISFPPLAEKIGECNADIVVFDCLDYPGEQFKGWERGFEQLRKRADIIFVSSQRLYDFNKAYSDKTFICRNGADYEHFSKVNVNNLSTPSDIAAVKRPIVGYFGAIADWIDWNLIGYLSGKKAFSMVFVGPLFNIIEPPVKAENVFYLGRKEYNSLPNYLQSFDVCIIPFKKSILTSSCNPVKMYEYLSAGKPVVTTDLEECDVGIVNISKGNEEFYENIIKALNDSKEKRQERMQFARENSWEIRVKYIRTIIEPRLGNKLEG